MEFNFIDIYNVWLYMDLHFGPNEKEKSKEKFNDVINCLYETIRYQKDNVKVIINKNILNDICNFCEYWSCWDKVPQYYKMKAYLRNNK